MANVNSEALAVLQARRDAVFTSAQLYEERCSEAWADYERRATTARDAWREHAALCDAIAVLAGIAQ